MKEKRKFERMRKNNWRAETNRINKIRRKDEKEEQTTENKDAWESQNSSNFFFCKRERRLLNDVIIKRRSNNNKWVRNPFRPSPGIISVQLVIVMAWLVIEKPGVRVIYPYRHMAVLTCSVSTMSVLISLVYDMLLIVLCTLYAFKVCLLSSQFFIIIVPKQ